MAIVFMRLTVAQKAEMDRAAELAALPTSSWLRMVGLEAARKSVPTAKPAKLTKPPKPVSVGTAKDLRLMQEGLIYLHPWADQFAPHGPGVELAGQVYMTADEWLTAFPKHTLSTR